MTQTALTPRSNPLQKTLFRLLCGVFPALCLMAAFSGELRAQGSITEKKIGASGLPLPRFVSLRAAEVNLRSGPGIRYPILWVFQRRGWPVEIIDEFETWRQIRDVQDTTGWVHQSMLQGRRFLLIQGKTPQSLYREPNPKATTLARLEPGVLARLDYCANANWCRVEVQSFSGWLPAKAFYGSYQDTGGKQGRE